MKKIKLLLTSVFGPYGIADKYAEGQGMQMELFNNQITREQGVHSPRINYRSYGLYLMAENISVPTVVLDFPSWNDFTKELKEGYTHVGISFIIPNILKVKRMTKYIRENFPDLKIIVGGYGTLIPNLRSIISYDEICYEEGVIWLKKYFGDDVKESIKHPILFGDSKEYIYGFRRKPNAGLLLTGVGCKNACFFCATSLKFFNKYIPFLKTGKEIFDVCRKAEDSLGVSSFAILDENFLQDRERAKQLLIEMEKNKKPYAFSIFSTVEVIAELGIDFLIRLGVRMVWIGIESKKDIFNKTKGIDKKALIKKLQNEGISVIASSILFLEHHDKSTIQEDIDWAISIGADSHQFMQLTPYPGTPLYHKYVLEGKMSSKVPYTKQHGQFELSFKHPHFLPQEAAEYTRQAFRKKYETDGPSSLNLALTLAKGYKKVKEDFIAREKKGLLWNHETLFYEKSANPKRDEFMKLRIEKMRKSGLGFLPILLAAKVFAPNESSRKKSDKVNALYYQTFGKPCLKNRVKSLMLLCFATVEVTRIRLHKLLGKGDLLRQPPMKRIEYNINKY